MKKRIVMVLCAVWLCLGVIGGKAEVRVDGQAFLNAISEVVQERNEFIWNNAGVTMELTFDDREEEIELSGWFTGGDETTLPDFANIQRYTNRPEEIHNDVDCSNDVNLILDLIPAFWEADGHGGNPFVEENIEKFKAECSAPDDSMLQCHSVAFMDIGGMMDVMVFGLQYYSPETGEIYGENQEWMVNNELYLMLRNSVKDGNEEYPYVRTYLLITDQNVIADIARAIDIIGEDEGRYSILHEWLKRRENGKAETSEAEIAEEGMNIKIHKEGNVNVRQKSSADSAKVGSARAGATYPCLSVADNGWFEIQLEDGTVGFVSPKMATIVEE